MSDNHQDPQVPQATQAVKKVSDVPSRLKTCDRCRVKKIKCLILMDDDLTAAKRAGEEDKCRACFRGKHDCTSGYVYKKPGRPLGRRTGDDHSRSPYAQSLSPGARKPSYPPYPPHRPSHDHGESSRSRPSASPNFPSIDTNYDRPMGSSLFASSSSHPFLSSHRDDNHAGPASGTIFGSAQTFAPNPADTLPFSFDGANPDWSINHSLSNDGIFPDLILTSDLNGISSPRGDRAPLIRMNSGADGDADAYWTEMDIATPGSTFRKPSTSMSNQGFQSGTSETAASPQVDPTLVESDAIMSWADINFFLKLYVRYQHPVLPLVHKPTFSQDVLTRRDRVSDSFRGLVCSIVAYTICQCPKNIMTRYTQAQLESLLARCRRSSRAAQIRQHDTPNLTVLISTIMDWITNIGTGKASLANVQMGEATRMLFALGLNKEIPRSDMDFIELQLCRRCYWSVYTSDKTDALSGSPISLNDFEGSPPLPLEVDDEFMTPQGSLPQPNHRPSYMSGYVSVVKLFQILSECIVRQRTFTHTPSAGPQVDTLKRWIEDAQIRVRDVLNDGPEFLRAGEDSWAEGDVFGTQKANCLITALCVEFSLLDFKASIWPEADTKEEREVAAREAYNMLSRVPIEHLASNGESMRGKVLRIVLALLSATSDPQMYSQSVWDWWNMYSRVQYVQVIPVAEIEKPEVDSPVVVVS